MFSLKMFLGDAAFVGLVVLYAALILGFWVGIVAGICWAGEQIGLWTVTAW